VILSSHVSCSPPAEVSGEDELGAAAISGVNLNRGATRRDERDLALSLERSEEDCVADL
jgi:hypothetical protein